MAMWEIVVFLAWDTGVGALARTLITWLLATTGEGERCTFLEERLAHNPNLSPILVQGRFPVLHFVAADGRFILQRSLRAHP